MDQNTIERTYQIDIQVDEAFATDVDVSNLDAAIQEALRQHHIRQAALSLIITDDEYVQTLNHTYRGINSPTDILSFGNSSNISEDSASSSQAESIGAQFVIPDELAEEWEHYLGDLIIAYPYSQRQAQLYQNTMAAELRLLVVHGTLHLLGYDHGTPEEEAHMCAAQNAVLAIFGDDIHISQRHYESST